MKKKEGSPPRIPGWIIRKLSHSYHRLTALGDLQELYTFYIKERGIRWANRWYWKQALKSVPFLSRNLIYWSTVMFRNYMKMSWRNIIRNKGFSLINISGLTVGMACCILIMIFMNNELSYDRFHEKSSRIYRANTISSIGVSRRIYPSVPAVFADGIKEAVPEVESFTRIIYGGSLNFQYIMGEEQTPAFLLDPYYCRLEAYFLVRDGIEIRALEKKIDTIAQTQWGEVYKSRGTTREFFLLNIRDIHLKSPCELEHFPIGDINNVYLFSAIAILVLMIACFNFINLSTARSADRATEVGIRKVIGSQKSRLIRQFLSESVIISIFSLSAAVLLVILVLPSFGSLVGVELHRGDALNFSILAGILMIVILTGFVAGSFPAFFLSALDPIKVLKGKMSGASKNTALRKILVVFQFSISIFMIAGILTVIRQLDYIRSKDLGFHKDHMLIINSRGLESDVLREQIKGQPGVISTCFSMNVPGVFNAFRSYSTSLEDPDAEG